MNCVQWEKTPLDKGSRLHATARQRDHVITVHPYRANAASHRQQSRQQEFDRLVDACCDCQHHHSILVSLRRLFAGTLLGKGHIESIAEKAEQVEADVIFVDYALSPVQQRNLEKAWDCKVVDRTGLILEIFAARARTREGSLQVELASLNYQISRLVRSWTHLERQRGGFGFMGGPGERQIELDRRMIRNRIQAVEKELVHVRRMRSTQRAGRKRREIRTAALVGYTNAGKSTLFNALTDADVHVADQLFATLDPTLRTLHLHHGQELLLSDTVGFVQELPHELVDAFRATLEEVIEADLILHVRDAADPEADHQAKVVRDTLQQLGLDGDHAPPMIEIWNKKDLAPNAVSVIRDEINGSRIALSAQTGEGIHALRSLLHTWMEQDICERQLTLSTSDGRTLAFCYEHGRVGQQEIMEDHDLLKVCVWLPARKMALIQCNQGIDKLKLSLS
ncbi:MAG: GTPase HflX [Mariprofundaceae bacterium]